MPTMASALILALLGGRHALAATPVLYDGLDPNVAKGLVMVETRTPAEELEALTVGELMHGQAPSLVGAGRVTACVGEAHSMAEIAKFVEQARGAVDYMEYGTARASLDAAKEALGCLGEPLTADVVAQLYFLSGYLAFEMGDKASAWSDYHRALGFDPNLEWNAQYAPESQCIFERARAESDEAERVTLAVLPPLHQGSIAVDGHSLGGDGGQVALVPGEHIVQIAGEPILTLRVQLESATNPVLVLPGYTPHDAASWAAREELRPTLSGLLASVLDQGRVVYAAADTGLWTTRVGSDVWEELLAPEHLGHMTMRGLPEGSQLFYTPVRGGTTGLTSLPWGEGELDEATGLTIAPDVHIVNLRRGEYSTTLHHPLLGDTGGSFTVVGSETTRLQFDWSEAPGLPELTKAWEHHLVLQRRAADSDRARKISRWSIAGSGALGVGTVGMLIGISSEQAVLSAAEWNYDRAVSHDELEDAAEFDAHRQDARSTVVKYWIGSGALMLAADVTLVVGLLQRKKARSLAVEVPAWEPEHLQLDLPEHNASE